MSWGDEIDEELMQDTDIKVGFMINFKKIYLVIDQIIQETREANDKHPRDSFRKIWGGVMFMIFILAALSYNVLIIATLPFMLFYFYNLIQLSKAYKAFNYSRTKYWLTTIAALVIIIGSTYFLRTLIFG